MLQRTLLGLMCLVGFMGCAAPTRDAANRARVLPSDIDRLAGAPWVGTLTYRDYKTGKPVTIDSSLIVKRVGEEPPTWEFGVGYSKEPHADSKETVVLSRGGEMLGDEQVVSREVVDGGVKIVLEADGEDDRRKARFRFEHEILEKQYTRRKMVRFEGEREFFERHAYRLGR